MFDWSYIFDGWGTALVVFFLDTFVSGFIGYKIGVRVTQKQVARNNANQVQSLKVDCSEEKKAASSKSFSQKQIASDNATQNQCGEIHNGIK